MVLLFFTTALVLGQIIAAADTTVQFGPNGANDTFAQQDHETGVADEQGGVYLCLESNWGRPCTYHRPSLYPNYPICWTSMGLDQELPYKPLG